MGVQVLAQSDGIGGVGGGKALNARNEGGGHEVGVINVYHLERSEGPYHVHTRLIIAGYSVVKRSFIALRMTGTSCPTLPPGYLAPST